MSDIKTDEIYNGIRRKLFELVQLARSGKRLTFNVKSAMVYEFEELLQELAKYKIHSIAEQFFLEILLKDCSEIYKRLKKQVEKIEGKG